MSLPHAVSGEIIDIRPLGKKLGASTSTTLIRASHLEVFRLILKAGKSTREHRAAGLITIQCLEGRAELLAHGKQQTLQAGDLVYLSDAEPHDVLAIEDSSLLVTILLHRA